MSEDQQPKFEGLSTEEIGKGASLAILSFLTKLPTAPLAVSVLRSVCATLLVNAAHSGKHVEVVDYFAEQLKEDVRAIDGDPKFHSTMDAAERLNSLGPIVDPNQKYKC
jgi:hypothetical protein